MIPEYLGDVAKHIATERRKYRETPNLNEMDWIEIQLLEARLEAVTLARRALKRLIGISAAARTGWSEQQLCRFLGIPLTAEDLDQQMAVMRFRVTAGLDPIPPIYRKVLESTPLLDALAKAAEPGKETARKPLQQ